MPLRTSRGVRLHHIELNGLTVNTLPVIASKVGSLFVFMWIAADA